MGTGNGINAPLISYRNIAKAFGDQVVCTDFNLDVARGETMCLIGPSGAGKTVLIKMLIGLTSPDSGTLMFDQTDLTQFDRDEQFLPIRKRIAMVFQNAALFDSLSVFENVAFALRHESRYSESEIEQKVAEKLAWVGLPDAVSKMPDELSGGMKKRVGLARAIASDPEVILYDEPTAGLDPINTVRICDLIISLQGRMRCTSIVVTHDIPAAARISDRAAMIYGGVVRAVGTVAELKVSEDRYVRGFMLGDPKLVDD